MNAMFTTCPGCRMNLALTPKDLRVGQGYVRCGRCERVFNALLSLSEDVDESTDRSAKATGTTTVPALEDIDSPEIDHQEIDPQQIDAPAPAPGDIYDLSDLEGEGNGEVDVVEELPTGSYETIVLEGDTFLQTEEMIGEDQIDEQIQEIARQINSQAEHDPAQYDLSDADDPPLDADAAVGNRPHSHWAWPAAIAVLALLLLGQVVHHYRHALVARPWLERPLAATYRLFGVTLEPAWDLSAYDLRQLGGEALGTSTTIVLRASIHNRSPHPQPPPMIRVVLQDRYGNAIATQAIAPAEYARGAAPARMAPDQRLDGELKLDDPNRQAVGFELDACLPAADAQLHCSSDR
jgi:predicted Zn finger-like uncharacterized protein